MSHRRHYGTCNLCEAMCGLEIEIEDDEIVSIRGDEEDVLSAGYICPKGPALAGLQKDPDRLRKPVQRTDSGWRELPWDEALDMAAEGLHELQVEHGNDALAFYAGNPTYHDHGSLLFMLAIRHQLRTRHLYSTASVDHLPQLFVGYCMYGHQLLLPLPDIEQADYMLILGANPLVSNGSGIGAPNVRKHLKGLQARGGKIVVIDPRRSETAQLADEHIFVRPGTDALLLLAMIHVIMSEGLERPGRLADFTRGFERVKEVAARFPPERVAEATGVPAERIASLARELAEREGLIYGRVGVSTHDFGSLTHWAIQVLNVLTGALDRRGGMMFSTPAVDPVPLPAIVSFGAGEFNRWRSRVRGLPEFGGELPAVTLAEDIEAGQREIAGEGEPGELASIRGLLTMAANPVLSAPDGGALDRALAKLDFMVAIDMYINETSRHAQLILPPTTVFERSHYDIAFRLFSSRRVAKWSAAALPKPEGTLHDWEIVHGLWSRLLDLRGGDSLVFRAINKAYGRFGPDGIVAQLLTIGPVGRALPRLFAAHNGGRYVDMDTLAANPHGVDLGPPVSCLPGRLPRNHRYIDLAPELVLEDLDRLDELCVGEVAEVEDRDGAEFMLIGRRVLRSNNSWLHNIPKLVAGKAACTLLIHPKDAERVGLEAGTQVEVRSSSGAIVVSAEPSDEVMRGVVSLPHGYGHGRSGVRMTVAAEQPGGSHNDLTDVQRVDAPTGTASFSGTPVTLRPVPAP